MKKMLCTLLALLMLLACVPAFAAGVPAYTPGSEWEKQYEILDFIQPDGQDYAFLAVRGEYSNRLLCFRWQSGEWKLQWNRKNAMPDPDRQVILSDLSGLVYNGTPLQTAFAICEEGPTGWECVYEQDGSTWKLRMICWRDTDGSLLEIYRVEAGVVKYEGWRKSGQQRIYGTLQNDLRYFSWQDFPFDPDELRSIMSEPPRIPGGNLSAQRIQFKGGQKYPVYNGPGKEYGQSGEGKAHVSTNDWIQVFGEEDGWIMIQYDITRDHMRIGWIDAEALPVGKVVTQLRFTPVTVSLTAGANLTDDPLGEQAAITYIRQGMSVQWLATMGEWAYVETTDGSLLRGFIPLSRIDAQGEWEK